MKFVNKTILRTYVWRVSTLGSLHKKRLVSLVRVVVRGCPTLFVGFYATSRILGESRRPDANPMPFV